MINVIINYPDDMTALIDKANEVLADILIKKLSEEELEQFKEVFMRDEIRF